MADQVDAGRNEVAQQRSHLLSEREQLDALQRRLSDEQEQLTAKDLKAKLIHVFTSNEQIYSLEYEASSTPV